MTLLSIHDRNVTLWLSGCCAVKWLYLITRQRCSCMAAAPSGLSLPRRMSDLPCYTGAECDSSSIVRPSRKKKKWHVFPCPWTEVTGSAWRGSNISHVDAQLKKIMRKDKDRRQLKWEYKPMFNIFLHTSRVTCSVYNQQNRHLKKKCK